VKSESAIIMMTIQGDRRLGIERRLFEYSGHYPERRRKEERRNGADRRGYSSCHEEQSDRRCSGC